NLRVFHQDLVAYSDTHHGNLPKVEMKRGHNFAGVFVPVLATEGLLKGKVSVNCPTVGMRPPEQVTMEEIENEADNQPEQFEEHIRRLAGCYAYSLGYFKDGVHQGLHSSQQPMDGLPIMADKPPFDQTDPPDTLENGNSPNHGGSGQNVLYLGG